MTKNYIEGLKTNLTEKENQERAKYQNLSGIEEELSNRELKKDKYFKK